MLKDVYIFKAGFTSSVNFDIMLSTGEAALGLAK